MNRSGPFESRDHLAAPATDGSVRESRAERNPGSNPGTLVQALGGILYKERRDRACGAAVELRLRVRLAGGHWRMDRIAVEGGEKRPEKGG